MQIIEIKNNLNRDLELSKLACLNSQAIRLKAEKSDIRPAFFRDADRILYSSSYTRYIDKTQVFTHVNNDNISKRMTHVQMVSKIARTIGRALKLNEDLIEAAALGHDLGHVPFGHVGEKILNEISLAAGEGYFHHNIQSVRDLMYLEHNGKGLNLTLQVLDAIMAHNGELLLPKLEPQVKDFSIFMEEYNNSYIDVNGSNAIVPMTLEGCVVRFSDIIAYIGKDIEDAITLNRLSINELPISISQNIGITNGQIIDTFVNDIIENSYGKNYIAMSSEKFAALIKLEDFNYQHIYNIANSKDELAYYQKVLNAVYNYNITCIKKHRISANIYQVYLNSMSKNYLNSTSDSRKVLDYIAGMTDDYLINEYNLIDKN
jgi:dGTPase